MITLGSLFSGSGSFEFAGSLVGIKPIWNAEIEKFPRSVTDVRFPHVKQLGDVMNINGAAIEPVDIITFGSPCQDLSIAGKQAGIIEGSRSSLFFQAIRIIKEMRQATNNQYPKFAVWENVRNALSSNKGDDFYEVLQAFASVCEPEISIPRPKKWEKSGWVDGNGWSVAWRLYDAQYWGVPQRRKRIYLVADFGKERVGEILFKCESGEGGLEESRTPWKENAVDAEGGVRGSSEPICLNFQGNKCGCCATQDGKAYSLNAMHGHDVHVIVDRIRSLNPANCKSKQEHDIDSLHPAHQTYNDGGGRSDGIVYALQGNGIDRSDTAGCNGCGWRTDQMYTLNTVDRPGVCYDARGNGDGKTVPTLTGDHQNRITDYTAILCQTVGSYMQFAKDVTNTLMARDYKDPQVVCMENDNQHRKYIVRRLTPLECLRLQGLPDWWCDGVKCTDSAIYKMAGNGIAVPCAVDVLGKIANILEN